MVNKYYSDSNTRKTSPIIRMGEVIDNSDLLHAGLIKAMVAGQDKLESKNSIIECIPLLPKFLTALPKVGESIFIFQYEIQESPGMANFNTKRFWLGPLITQPTKLDNDPTSDSNAILPDGWTKLKDPNLEEGAYGNKEDIILQGRYNTDIIQKDREIWLRVGKFIEGSNNKFNDKDLGYIQLKYGGDKLKRVVEDTKVENLIYPKPTTIITASIITGIAGSATVDYGNPPLLPTPSGAGEISAEDLEASPGAIINWADIFKVLEENGQALPEDLPVDEYLQPNVTKTIVKIDITKTNTSVVPPSFQRSFNNRNEALVAAKNYIDSQKGAQWKIKSGAKDLLKSFPNVSKGSAIYSNTPEKIIKTIKMVKIVPNDDKLTSVINVVANKINLLSYDGDHTFELTNPKKLITDDEQEKINNEAHPLVYGDKLVEFLKLVKTFVNLHVHPYHGTPPDPGPAKLDVLRFDLQTILNHNINSN